MTATTWLLIILIRSTTPPLGVVVEGFASEADCWAEAKQYCDGNPKYHCACRRNVREDG